MEVEAPAAAAAPAAPAAAPLLIASLKGTAFGKIVPQRPKGDANIICLVLGVIQPKMGTKINPKTGKTQLTPYQFPSLPCTTTEVTYIPKKDEVLPPGGMKKEQVVMYERSWMVKPGYGVPAEHVGHGAYRMLGVGYEVYQGPEDPEPRVSLTFSRAVEYEESIFDLIRQIPFASRSIVKDRDAWKPVDYDTGHEGAVVVVVVDQYGDAAARHPIGFDDGASRAIIDVPSAADASWLYYARQEAPDVRLPGFRGEPGSTHQFNGANMVIAQISADNVQSKFAALVNIYQENVADFKFSESQWMALGLTFMRAFYGVMVGRVDRPRTAQCHDVGGDFDGVVALKSHLIPEMVTIVQRIGIKLDGASAKPYLVATAADKNVVIRQNDDVVNLTVACANGQCTAEAALTASEIYVVGSWCYELHEIAEINAMPLKERLDCLKDVNKNFKPRIKDQSHWILFGVEPGLRTKIEAASKRQKPA